MLASIKHYVTFATIVSFISAEDDVKISTIRNSKNNWTSNGARKISLEKEFDELLTEKNFKASHNIRADKPLHTEVITQENLVHIHERSYTIGGGSPIDLYADGALYVFEGEEVELPDIRVFRKEEFGNTIIMTKNSINDIYSSVERSGEEEIEEFQSFMIHDIATHETTDLTIIQPGVVAVVEEDDIDYSELNELFRFDDMEGEVLFDENLDATEDIYTADWRESEGHKMCTKFKILEFGVVYESSFCSQMGGRHEAETEVQRLVSSVSHKYEKVGLCTKIKIKYLEGWCDSDKDPYQEFVHLKTLCSGTGGVLDQFSKYWNEGNKYGSIERDATHLFSGTGFGADSRVLGCAYIGGLCNKYSYGVDFVTYTSSLAMRDTLIAHELGHNCGGTHINKNYHVMSPFMSKAKRGFHPHSIEQISEYMASATCVAEDEDICPSFSIELKTDNYGNEISWQFQEESSNKLITNGGPYDGQETDMETVCVDANKCYKFTITDAYGDGMLSDGYYKLTFNGVEEPQSDNHFGHNRTHLLGNCFSKSKIDPLTTSPTQSVRPSDMPTSPSSAYPTVFPSARKCPSFDLELRTDSYAIETKWAFKQKWDEVILLESGELKSDFYYKESSCVDPNKCYVFEISDTFGDGLESGFYNIIFNDVEIPDTDNSYGTKRTHEVGACNTKPLEQRNESLNKGLNEYSCPSFDLTLQTDGFSAETSWTLRVMSNNTIIRESGSGVLTDNTLYNEHVCIDPYECYEFDIFDSFGDGIGNDGFYRLSFNGVEESGTDNNFGGKRTHKMGFCRTVCPSNLAGGNCPLLKEPFSDMSEMSSSPPIIGVKSIKIYHSTHIEGVQTTYRLADGGTYEAPTRGKNITTPDIFNFPENETIISIFGRSGCWIDQLGFKTRLPDGSLQFYGPCGSKRGGFPFEMNGNFISMIGAGQGDILTQLGMDMTSPCE